MTTRKDKKFIFQWKIENLSHCCWLREGVKLVSPSFIADKFYSSRWSLHLYPMGYKKLDNAIGFVLFREEDSAPIELEVKYHFAFLGKDGTVLKGFYQKFSFKTGEGDGKSNFESQKRVFLTQRKEYLPDDTLTVQLTLWIDGDTFVTLKHIYARTVFKLNQRSVLWKIDKFSSEKSGLRNKFKDDLIDLDLILNKDIFNMDVISYDDSIKYISVILSIIDSEGKKTNCGVGEFNGRKTQWSSLFGEEVEYGNFDSTPYYVSCIPKKLMKSRGRYIPNDILSLNIEYIYSTVTNSCEYFYNKLTNSSKSRKELVEDNNEHYVRKEKKRRCISSEK